MVGKAASLATGFLFWFLAAHVSDAHNVGVAAGAVAAMMLTTQLAVVGAGPAFILNHAQLGGGVGRLLNTVVTLVSASSLILGAAFLALTATVFEQFQDVVRDPLFAGAFLGMSVLGSLGIVLDHASVALGRGAEVVTRNVLTGLLTLGPLVAVSALGGRLDARSLFLFWPAGAAVGAALGWRQLTRRLGGLRYRPLLPRDLTLLMLRSGLPNHALTLVERVPNLVLPVIVTETLSPALNAYWYVAWMMAWGVLVIPVQVGLSLLAHVSASSAGHANGRPAEGFTRAVQAALSLGVPGAVVVAGLAGPVLSAIGPDYARFGTTPLRVLLLGLVPALVIQLYFAACRARGRIREAVCAGAATGLLLLAATPLVALTFGLVGLAALWVAAQTAGSCWAGWRLRALIREWRRSSPPPVGGSARGPAPATVSERRPA